MFFIHDNDWNNKKLWNENQFFWSFVVIFLICLYFHHLSPKPKPKSLDLVISNGHDSTVNSVYKDQLKAFVLGVFNRSGYYFIRINETELKRAWAYSYNNWSL